MEVLREQMFVVLILKLFRRFNDPTKTLEWLGMTATLLGLDDKTMQRLAFKILKERFNLKKLHRDLYIKLRLAGVPVADIIRMSGKARSTCYEMFQEDPTPYIRRLPEEDDEFIRQALEAFKTLGGDWYC